MDADQIVREMLQYYELYEGLQRAFPNSVLKFTLILQFKQGSEEVRVSKNQRTPF
jgi:hypothetical protein